MQAPGALPIHGLGTCLTFSNLRMSWSSMIRGSFGHEHGPDWRGAMELPGKLKCSLQSRSAAAPGKCCVCQGGEFGPAIEQFLGTALWGSFRKASAQIFTFSKLSPQQLYWTCTVKFLFHLICSEPRPRLTTPVIKQSMEFGPAPSR